MSEESKIVGVDVASGPDMTAHALYYGPSLMGLNVVLSEAAVSWVEDWSRCRSPSRARRRHKQGRAQHVRMKAVPGAMRYGNSLVLHPDTWRAIDAKLSENMRSIMAEKVAQVARLLEAPIKGGFSGQAAAEFSYQMVGIQQVNAQTAMKSFLKSIAESAGGNS